MYRVSRMIRSVFYWLRFTFQACVGRMPKSIRFALIGAVGCLGGALVGEGLLMATRSVALANSAVGPRSICLVLDHSGSMQHGKLEEVKAAAKSFARRQDLSKHYIAVVGFAGDANIAIPLTRQLGQIETAIDRLRIAGGTAIHLGLRAAEQALSDAGAPRHILLFTDGQPTWRAAALATARSVRHRGIQIVAIGTGDADTECMTRIAGDPRLVLWARSGQFEEAFQAAEYLIAGASLVDASGGYDSAHGLARTSGWTTLLALGLGTSLIGGQNRYLRRLLFSQRDLVIGIGGCTAAGLLAGGLSQGLFWMARSDFAADALDSVLLGTVLGIFCAAWFRLSTKRVTYLASTGALVGLILAVGGRWLAGNFSSWLLILLAVPAWGGVGALLFWAAGKFGAGYLSAGLLRAGVGAGIMGVSLLFLVQSYVGQAALLLTDASTRLMGWSILGCLLSLGLSFFIPNLNRRHALIAGAISGIFGAMLYLTIGVYLGGSASRLIGALALGFSMGLMIVIAEAACREHWLEVAYLPQDRRTINLGPEAVTVGDNRGPRQPNGRPQQPAGLTYRVENDAVVCHDAGGRICRVLPGQTTIIDGAQVTVRSRS